MSTIFNTPIKLENVSSVYSGIVGQCACGCSGKHTYSSRHQAWAGKNRGYEVTDDEVNDLTIKKLVNKFNRMIGTPEANEVEIIDNDCISLDTETRTYVIYLQLPMRFEPVVEIPSRFNLNDN